MKRTFVLIALALACGCSHEAPRSETHAADNTANNARDRGAELPTPMDQGENQVDLKLAQAVRQALIADDSLSFNAKNVKVIVQAGVVTLRGVVDSQDEKTRIATKAQALAGVNRVEDLLEVKSG